MKKKKDSNTFCHDIFNTDLPYGKVLINLLLSLSSGDSGSVVGLSESALFEHHYSSISQCIDGLSGLERDLLDSLRAIFLKYYPAQSTYDFQTDTSPLTKAHSHTLADRQYVNVPNNVIAGNKSLDIGYNYSYVNLGYQPPIASNEYATGVSGSFHNRWSLPLSVERVGLQSDAISTALSQIATLMADAALPFKTAQYVTNATDTGYFSARYFTELVEQHPNLIPICRARHGNKVWAQATPEQAVSSKSGKIDKRGATKIYGDTTYYLIAHSDEKVTSNGKTKTEHTKQRTSIYDLPPSESIDIQTITSRGRELVVKIDRWDNLLVRTKKGYSMKDKPFNLCGTRVIDKQTGELVFQKPMFVAAFGKLKDALNGELIYQKYRNRYDIEGHNRFNSQQLLLNDFQTPEVKHLDTWAKIVAIANWLLFVAADEIQLQLKPWEQYLPKNKQAAQQQEKKIGPKLSIAQTKKSTGAFFYTFDRKPFAPKSVKNGKGRKMGSKIEKRKYQKVNLKQKKNNKKSNFDNKTQFNE